MSDEPIEVRHNKAASRFEATVEGKIGVAEYQIVGNVMRLNHTEVPASVTRRGVAGQIVAAALAHADAQGLKVEPRCSYVRNYMKRHPETQRLLPDGFPLH